MGFLQYSNVDTPLNFNKVVISLWYRIPAASAAVVRDAYQDFVATDYFGMAGIVPLLVFGPQQSDTIYETGSLHIHHDPIPDHDGTGVDSNVPHITGNHSANTPPSFIGVMFSGGSTENALAINIQASELPTAGAGSKTQITDITFNESTGEFDDTYEDISYVYEGAHVNFGGTGFLTSGTDEWIHLLVSWDVGTSEVGTGNDGNTSEVDISTFITTDAKMWIACNDVNKNGADLPVTWLYKFDSTTGGDPNSICLNQIMNIAGINPTALGNPSLTASIGTIPTNSVSIPGPASVLTDAGTDTGPVQVVQLADVQIFTGVTLDTSVEANRRAFITEDLKPVSPALAQTLLGQVPDILFQTSGDWITGSNRGGAGNFDRTGTINDYTTSVPGGS